MQSSTRCCLKYVRNRGSIRVYYTYIDEFALSANLTYSVQYITNHFISHSTSTSVLWIRIRISHCTNLDPSIIKQRK